MTADEPTSTTDTTDDSTRVVDPTTPAEHGTVPLSVVIIAKNEADRIEACIESVFSACRSVSAFEVILVDSDSTDRTVELASEYPITILRIPEEHASVGAGRFVGGQTASGELLLFVDADMTLTEEWLPQAIEYLAANDDTVGVEGCLDESTQTSVTEVGYIAGVALYDADELASIGGFDPFLLGYEDVDVGFQLTTAGKRLVRLPEVSATHDDEQTIGEPLRRLRQGYYVAPGQTIRKWLSSPAICWRLLRRQKYKLGVVGWLTTGVLSLRSLKLALGWLALSAVGFALIARKRGLMGAVDFLATKTLAVGGLVDGLRQPPQPASAFPLSAVETVVRGEPLRSSSELAETASTPAEKSDWAGTESERNWAGTESERNWAGTDPRGNSTGAELDSDRT